MFRQPTLKPIIFADLGKAAREAAYPEIRRPQREVWIEPTIEDLALFEKRHIIPSPDLSIDIETAQDQITCIGFAPDPFHVIVVPWQAKFKRLIKELLADPKVEKLFQNGAYDVQRLNREGCPVVSWTEDTMLLHAVLFPELPKSLEFLGSIYTQERAWKQLRPRGLGKEKKE